MRPFNLIKFNEVFTMHYLKTILLLLAMMTLLLVGCTSSRSSKIYTEGEALQAEDVQEGVVESVEPATIRKDGTLVGTTSGTILGGIGASTVGSGIGKELAAVGGAIIGGLLGHYIEQGITDREALKIVIKLNNGEKIVIVQEADVLFEPGEKVNVFSSRVGNTTRVSKMPGSKAISPTK
jgi:outer membrane lipoprotein SlyB